MTEELDVYGQLSQSTVRYFAQNMANTLDRLRFATLQTQCKFKPAFKEETIVQHRFGERKPHTGKRLYRLWIDGVWVGDFKSKAERRKILESTQVLMEEPNDITVKIQRYVK